jgi:HEAT repeat protein
LEDDSPMVRITAAEALGRYGSERDAAAALKVLLRYAAPAENAYLNLAAWNSMDYLDERAQPARERLKSIRPSPANPPPRWGDYTRLVKRRTLADLQLENSASK